MQELFDLIDALYRAALEPDAWQGVLDTLRVVIPSAAMHVVVSDGRGAAFGAQSGHDPDVLAAYERDFADRDPWAASSLQMPEGSYAPSEYHLPVHELERTEMYNELLGPLGLKHGFGATIARVPGAPGILLNGLREGRAGPYQDEDLAPLAVLVPHLRRAFDIARRLDTLKSEREEDARLLDRLLQAVVVVDEAGRVLRTNLKGDALLRRGDGLRVRRGRIEARTPAETCELQRAIVACATTSGGRGGPAGRALRIRRAPGGPFQAVLVAPLALDHGVWGVRDARAVLFVTEGDEPVTTREEWLARVYGLTPAEARVALGLANGRSVEELADELRVRVSTVRTHLKQVLGKTSTRRQAELVRLLLTGPLVTPAPKPG